VELGRFPLPNLRFFIRRLISSEQGPAIPELWRDVLHNSRSNNDGENPPVGLILCAEKDSAVAKYALEGLPNKVLAAEYKLALPGEERLVKELEATRKKLAGPRTP